MPIIDWNVTLMLGITLIDQQHQHLVQLLNKAYDDFREGVDVPASVIAELIDSSNLHFAYEETLMADCSYPKTAEHKNEHQLFSGRVLELHKKYQQGANVSIELLWFLCNWVTHHIRETDADLARFLDVCNIRKRLQKQQPITP